MKILDLFKIKKAEKLDWFSEFFLNTSEHEKRKVFREAAERANLDQRKVLEEANLKV